MRRRSSWPDPLWQGLSGPVRIAVTASDPGLQVVKPRLHEGDLSGEGSPGGHTRTGRPARPAPVSSGPVRCQTRAHRLHVVLDDSGRPSARGSTWSCSSWSAWSANCVIALSEPCSSDPAHISTSRPANRSAREVDDPLPQIVVAHTALDVAGHRADRRTSGGAASEADERDPRHQHAGSTDGEAPAHPGCGTVAGRPLMLLHHTDLAALVAIDHSGVEIVRRLHVVVQGLDRLVVGLRVGHVVVRGRENQHHVLLAHTPPLHLSQRRARRTDPYTGSCLVANHRGSSEASSPMG